MDPRVKIISLVGLVFVSVSLAPGAWWSFAALGVLLVSLTMVARLRAGFVLRRMTVEIPFLLATAALPFTVPGGWSLAGAVAAKITIGVLAMVVLGATTPFPRLLRGFELLRVPRLLTVIVAFMWRYAYVLASQASRMSTARAARGYSARWLWQATSTGPLLGTLFVRSLERGERVYLAMLSRGYTGGVPPSVVEPLALSRGDVTFGVTVAGFLATIRMVPVIVS